MRIFRLFIPLENAICATSPVRETIVPTPNFLCSTRSPRENSWISFLTCAQSQKVFSFGCICDQSHARVDSPEVPRKSVIKSFLGWCISVYSFGISLIKRLAILLEYVPKLYRSLARVTMSFFFARVIATYQRRRSSSS